MESIRFSILLSLLFFGGYANHTAEKNIKERRLNNMRLVKLKDGITDENYAIYAQSVRHT